MSPHPGRPRGTDRRLGWRVILTACAALVCIAGLAGIAVARSGTNRPGWSATRQLVAPTVQTFSPELAVNGQGRAVAAWFTGPAPPTYSAPDAANSSGTWTGNDIAVSMGSITDGLGKPTVVGHDGTDIEAQIKVAVSGSGVAFVAWRSQAHPWAEIATSEGGRFSSPRRLELPAGASLMRLVAGLRGPVDALSDRANGHGIRFFCTRLNADGSSGQTVVAVQPYKLNTCHLHAALRLVGAMPPRMSFPPGFQLGGQSLVSRTDGHGHSIAVWDDWPTSGPAWTYGIFYAVML